MCFNRKRGVVERGSAWALVTGAALGIGREYAEQLALKGYNLYLIDILESITQEADTIAAKHGVKCIAKCMNLAEVDAAKRLHIIVSVRS